MTLSQEESVTRHRRLQQARRRHASDRICRLIPVLGCFQLLVVTTLIGVAMLSPHPQTPSSGAASPSNLRQLEAPSASAQLDLWLTELLSSRVVDVQINTTRPSHLGFTLHGTLVPRPLSPNLFDGAVTFTDAQKHRHQVVIVRNRGYEWITRGDYGERLERSACLLPAQVPPLHTLRQAFATAQWTSDQSIQLAFANEWFRVDKRDDSVAVTASGLHLELSMRHDASTESPPDFVVRVHNLSPCPALFDERESTSDTATLGLAAEAVDVSGTQELADEACPCTSDEKKTCLFLHGIGVHEDVGLEDAYPAYWGSIETMLPCCSVVKFAHLNSVDTPWYDELFADRVCDALLAVALNDTFTLTNTTRRRTPHDVPVIQNTVVVAHSSGNLHLASALLYHKCQLDRATSKWIAIQGPMRGTNTANRVLDECAKPASGWDALVQTVVREFELCPVKNSTQALARAGTAAARGCLDTLFVKAYAIYEATVFASLCGVSPFGLTSTSSAKFVALATFSNHSSTQNDGVVELGSCALQATATYKATYRDRNRFYKASINHDDGRLIHGDGLWGNDRKPIKWLQCQF